MNGNAVMKAGWVGVGNMGRPMIEKIIDAGHDLTLYDTDPGAYDRLDDRLFTRVESPRAVADACKIVFFCLPSLLALRTAVMGQDGILSGRLEEHTSELQSLMRISYAVFCQK